MKILKDNEYNSLKSKADSYDAVVASVIEAGENLSADDITPQTIIDAMERTQEDDGSDYSKHQIESLNNQIQTLSQERDDAIVRAEQAESRIAELEKLPSVSSAGGKAPQRNTSESTLEELNEFAKAHQNDQPVIIEKIRESGIL